MSENNAPNSEDFSVESHLELDATELSPMQGKTAASRNAVIRDGRAGITKVTGEDGMTGIQSTGGGSVAGEMSAPEYRPGDVVEDRYEIRERLGRGGFGAVYSAQDRSLNRLVAIKQSTGLLSFVAGRVREEARAVASLNHPNIVQIHDLIQVSTDEVLIVMECLDGESLGSRMRRERLKVAESVKVGVEVANALMHAHEKQLVHSDLKPANLFVCSNGVIKLLDFGLAVAYFPDEQPKGIGGTPGYMSPEQIRGESHLIDGRSDIWAFGVVMFEMLTGTRPFVGKNGLVTNQRTLIKSVPPPRQLNPDIDTELQRIVLKCLEPLIIDRYDSVAQLREDLLAWLENSGNSGAEDGGIKAVLPPQQTYTPPSAERLGNRGLQPFTELDASAYLDLIPGSRDRNGIPDSIRFWKRWVESDDPHVDYPVGVLHGPSGSGKTSYIRAGLFQQLGMNICKAYIECRPGDLGGRLIHIIENRLNREQSGTSLRDLLYQLRSGDSDELGFDKLLIVLDQFESWAHTANLEERVDFAEALRQCDGIQIRVLVVTRDDYWLAAKELLGWLELPMVEGRNLASVELLDSNHAQQILETMGRESGSLPADDEPLSDSQRQFISQAVEELTVDGSVICVHLVMFAQMVRLQQWTPRGLRESGGVVGACGLFLQELFETSQKHSPEYRRIGPAVPALLSTLVPPTDRNVADVFATKKELHDAVTEAGHAHLFEDCLRVLCEDLRILAVIGTDVVGYDPDSTDNTSQQATDQYRLAHDFLVDPINKCLSRMQSRSWRGRTKSRLSESSSVWARRRNNAHLPGFVEYLSLVPGSVLTRSTDIESQFIRAATRYHAGRISAALLFFLGFIMMSVVAWSQWNHAKESRAKSLAASVTALLDGKATKIDQSIDELREFGTDATRAIEPWSEVDGNLDFKIRSQLYLQSVDPKSFKELGATLNEADPAFLPLIISIAKKTPDAISVLTELARDTFSNKSNRAIILLAYLGDDGKLLQRLSGSDDAAVDHGLLTESLRWRAGPQLWQKYLSASNDPQVRYHAAAILTGYTPDALNDAGLSIDLTSMVNDRSAVVHSVGRHLADHLGQNVFDIPLNPPADANWLLGPDNTPMVRVEPASFSYQSDPDKPSREVSVTRPFLMATTPVSRRLYAQFVQATDGRSDGFDPKVVIQEQAPVRLKSDDNQPIMGTTLGQAFEFYNWLSKRENLQPCYTPRTVTAVAFDRDKPTVQPIPWAFDATANGYRGPTVPEYNLVAYCEYKLGAGSRHATELATATGKFQPGLRVGHPVFTLLPSRKGIFLFDVYLGCWVSDDRYTNEYSTPDGVRRSMMQEHPIQGTGIYLAKNVATQD